MINLIRVRYLELLKNVVNPALIEIMENDQRYHEENPIFHQDRSYPHYALLVWQFPNERFPSRWIWRRVLSNSPPDFSPLDILRKTSNIYATQFTRIFAESHH